MIAINMFMKTTQQRKVANVKNAQTRLEFSPFENPSKLNSPKDSKYMASKAFAIPLPQVAVDD